MRAWKKNLREIRKTEERDREGPERERRNCQSVTLLSSTLWKAPLKQSSSSYPVNPLLIVFKTIFCICLNTAKFKCDCSAHVSPYLIIQFRSIKFCYWEESAIVRLPRGDWIKFVSFSENLKLSPSTPASFRGQAPRLLPQQNENK